MFMQKWIFPIALIGILSSCATLIEPKHCPMTVNRIETHVRALHPYDVAWLGTVLSQMGYAGNCPCPNSTDSAGNRCGARSAYSRGSRLACTADDVPLSDIPRLRTIIVAQATPIECGGGGLVSLLDWSPSDPDSVPPRWRQPVIIN